MPSSPAFRKKPGGVGQNAALPVGVHVDRGGMEAARRGFAAGHERLA
jgi:hypothetical protein